MAKYNASNSRSPMMFKKVLKVDRLGTGNERIRSKSMDHLADHLAEGPLIDTCDKTEKMRRNRGQSAAPRYDREISDLGWKELRDVKSRHPVVTCILPAVSMDFVASCLLAVGAIPLITEDPTDIRNDLDNCKAVVIDVSASRELVEAFLNCAEECSRDVPVILVISCCGSNNRKKDLASRLLEEVNVTMVTGRNGDIIAIAQIFLEKEESPLGSLSDVSDDDLAKELPKVVYNQDVEGDGSNTSLPPVLRRAMKNRRIGSPNPAAAIESSMDGGRGGTRSRDHSPQPLAAHVSPLTSPRASPVQSPMGVRKFLKKKNRAIERVPTILPRIAMKGQFRETQMGHVKVIETLEHAQKLCAHTSAFVHLYETNTVTSGEVVLEITNTQIGMGNLHSTLACSGAVTAAVLACLDPRQSDKVQVEHCGHALSLYYVAAQEAGSLATRGELVSPGTLRQTLIDILHRLSAEEVKRLTNIKYHSGELKVN